MKKITLIACAALIAGLFVSCNNDAGVKDYNNVTKTSFYNSYVVKGTVATTSEISTKTYNDKNELINTSSSSITDTKRIVSTPAYVSFETDENFDGNYENYHIVADASKGYKSSVMNSKTEWDSTAKEAKPYTAEQINAYNEAHKEAEEAVDITGEDFNILLIDDKVYIPGHYKSEGFPRDYNADLFEVTADPEKIAAGESFELEGDVVIDNSYTKIIITDANDKKTTTETVRNETVKYKLSFSAK